MVDLPAPERPTRPTFSPGLMCRVEVVDHPARPRRASPDLGPDLGAHRLAVVGSSTWSKRMSPFVTFSGLLSALSITWLRREMVAI